MIIHFLRVLFKKYNKMLRDSTQKTKSVLPLSGIEPGIPNLRIRMLIPTNESQNKQRPLSANTSLLLPSLDLSLSSIDESLFQLSEKSGKSRKSGKSGYIMHSDEFNFDSKSIKDEWSTSGLPQDTNKGKI